MYSLLPFYVASKGKLLPVPQSAASISWVNMVLIHGRNGALMLHGTLLIISDTDTMYLASGWESNHEAQQT